MRITLTPVELVQCKVDRRPQRGQSALRLLSSRLHPGCQFVFQVAETMPKFAGRGLVFTGANSTPLGAEGAEIARPADRASAGQRPSGSLDMPPPGACQAHRRPSRPPEARLSSKRPVV